MPKRRRLIDTTEDATLTDFLSIEPEPSGQPKKKRGRRTAKARKPSIKSRLLKKINARIKILRAKLRTLERDKKSLVCKRKKLSIVES